VSRGAGDERLDRGERESQDPDIPASRMPLSQGRGGGSNTTGRSRPDPGRERASEHPSRAPLGDRADERIRGKRYDLNPRERNVLRDIGRFRIISADDLLKHQYNGMASAMRQELMHLQQQGLLQRRTISVGKNRDTLAIVALTRDGASLARKDENLAEQQAVYAGFVKPAEVPHDAAIYQMYQAEARQIEARGGTIHRVVLDYELKKGVYSRLARERDAGALEYARRQQEIADEQRLPIVDGRIALPDLRIEYETPEGDLDRVDLELATEHYHRGHMDAKARAGFKMYGFVSTSRGHRAQWEGRELTAAVLAL
jgi:hypothetical protein